MGIFPFETSGWFLIETIRLSVISPQYHTLNQSKMEGDKKTRRREDEETRRQGDETNVMISGRNVSISNVLYSRIPVFLYSCIPVFLYSKTQVLNSLFNFIL